MRAFLPCADVTVSELNDVGGAVLTMDALTIELVMQEQDPVFVVGEDIEHVLLESAAGLPRACNASVDSRDVIS